MEGDASTNIIATPTIVTLDNEEAEIRVGQEVPFLTGSFAATGAAQGAVNPFQTIQRQEVGTRLAIT
ncbi:MAG: type II secretion system protein GspD, partial [Gammaproteobacteria bacterium]|nr:type II secretion system protein GspD [Gammaproteobacteria bacterium]